MREWNVTIPIAGHAFITVMAETEEQAIEAAFADVSPDHIEEWETLERFKAGNVCYCPAPWEVEAEDVGEVDGA